MEDAAEDEQVGAAVAVKIGDEGEHRVGGIFFEFLGLGSVNGITGLEVRTGIPEWSGNDVDVAVGVEVGGVEAVGPILCGEGLFLEGDGAWGGRGEAGEREREGGAKRGAEGI
ncbi:MAG: hypothetical protein CFE34_20010, partial [Rhodobacteraceae bacterium PARR1]